MSEYDLKALYDLSGRVAIVTGGSRGLGRAIAGGLVSAGAKVVISSRKADAVDATVAELTAAGGDAFGVPAHMGEEADIARLVDSTVEHFGAIDFVVNNAANALAQTMGNYTHAAWDKSLGVNLLGPVFLAQGALPHLERSDNAAILNVITAGVYKGAAGLSMYTAGKSALLHWTRTMAQELAPRGVRVNALAPGPFDTDMVRATGEQGAESMAKATLMRRIAQPSEIVGPALMLLSPAASYITGADLRVDGGLVA